MKTLETERLILRPFRTADLEDFYEYAQNPEVGPNAGWEPHADRSVSQSILQSFLEGDQVLAIVYRENGKVIGSIGLHGDRFREGAVNSRMLGYVLSYDYWGKGLMTEAARRVIRYAFEELELDLLAIQHFPFNERSRGVILKCGFTYEGVLRKSFRRSYDGLLLDEVCYSMTREEYEAMRPGWERRELKR